MALAHAPATPPSAPAPAWPALVPARPSSAYPDLDGAWPVAGPDATADPPYLLMARTFDALDRTRSRVLIVGVLAYLFRYLAVRAPAALVPAVFLCTNRVAPAFVPFELGVGGQVMSAAITEVTGRSATQLRADYNRLGDLGDVAQQARASAHSITASFVRLSGKSDVLTIPAVYRNLHELAATRGDRAVERKRARVRALLAVTRENETRWLVRTLIANLRVGAVDKTVVAALARAFAPPWPPTAATAAAWSAGANAAPDRAKAADADAAERLAACFSRRPDYRHLVAALLEGGLEHALASCDVQVGTPLMPMLGKITRYDWRRSTLLMAPTWRVTNVNHH